MTPILFIDLDGTLLDSKLQISQENVFVLQQAINANAEVVFSTGRPLASASRLAAQFRDIRYLICSNGGCLADLQKRSNHCVASFSESELECALEFGVKRGLSAIVYTVDRIMADSLSADVYLEVSRSGTELEIVDRLPNREIIKVLFVGQPSVIKRSFEEISSNSYLDRVAFSYISYPEYLEISPRGAGKVAAGKLLLSKLRRDWVDTITFGDSANDVEIMKSSAIAVAVANATLEAKEAATIVAPSNDEAGVAVALRWLLFGELDAKSKLQMRSPILHSSFSRKPS